MPPRSLSFLRNLLLLPLLLLCACGPGPEPQSLEGETVAADVVVTYLRATEIGDFDRAKDMLSPDPYYMLANPAQMREALFPIKSTSLTPMKQWRIVEDQEWRIAVVIKIGYGEQMKLLRFTLLPGSPPRLQGMLALKPEDLQ